MSNTVGPHQFINNAALDNKFKFIINLPEALKRINTKFAVTDKTVNRDSIEFNVTDTEVPDIIVPAIEAPALGANIYVSSHARPPFPPIKLQFLVDNLYTNYWTIYQWLNMLRDEKEGSYGSDPSQEIVNARRLAKDLSFTLKDYSTTFSLIAVDEFNNPILRWDYLNAFPTRLGGIQYNYQAGENIRSYFEFVYSNINCVRI